MGYTNLNKFINEIEDASKRQQVEFSLFLVREGFDLLRRIVQKTPVQTGRTQGNWQITVNRPADTVLDRTHASGPHSDAMSTLPAVKMGETVWFSNNVPWIERLEYEAWSKQAPNGMVRDSIAEKSRSFKQIS